MPQVNGLNHGLDISNGSGVGDIFSAKSVQEIKLALSQLHEREATVTTRLDTLLASQKEFQRELGRLDLLRAQLSSQASKTRSISNGMLSTTASTANRLSSSVRKLDLEQSRVKATLEVVEQVAELKACVLGVTGSMGAAQDWETAASYLNRAFKIPKEVIEGPFAARIVPSTEVPDLPQVTLSNASESLCGLFLREFDKAVKESDGAKITRFFKLFPLIGKSEVGLDVYGRYVCQGVAIRSRANLNAGTGGNQSKDGLFYANALTKLFEHIAQIIDNHGGLVERHYGSGKMARVIERLQMEADVQGGIILDTWADERSIDRKMTDIKSYAFTFLVQSFLPPQKGTAGTPRSNSPAQSRVSEDEGVDMKDVDGILGEMTMMLGRWSLYTRFISDKCRPEDTANSDDVGNSTSLPEFLQRSSLMKKITDRVINPFNSMTTFFFRRSIEKAFQLDEQPPDLSLNPHKPLNANPPHVTSAVDDVMYIVNKVLQQSLATSQESIIDSVVPTLSRVMSSDFIGMIQRKMRYESYPKAAIQGALPPEHIIVAFIVLINDLDVAMDYIQLIVSSQTESQTPNSPTPIATLFPSPLIINTIQRQLTSFTTTFTNSANTLLSEAIIVLFNQVLKPRLRPILLDSFRDIDYSLTADELASLSNDVDLPQHHIDNSNSAFGSEDPDLVRRRFQHGWDALTRPIARLMTDRTFHDLLFTAIAYLAKMLEKRIWGYYARLNELGAVRLERDVNAIINVVVGAGSSSGVPSSNKSAKGRYKFKSEFKRCLGILTICNLEEDEWEELQNVANDMSGVRKGEAGAALRSNIDDGLTPEERIRARGMIRDD
ncbi:putative conserved oligomeric golgi complex component 4 [Phaeomoniella chlamydospora]|uniref:Conserved oligomeric Golgi complex subunit 4 n=1 Tax=Phaeomoniella chlamydospora TaxID=158046 RepID=A0A0G2DX08_PHACM|nr:putative conserved oligomeric golgi complex component 4 [Phaeomoniella chlamydospora]